MTFRGISFKKEIEPRVTKFGKHDDIDPHLSATDFGTRKSKIKVVRLRVPAVPTASLHFVDIQ